MKYCEICEFFKEENEDKEKEIYCLSAFLYNMEGCSLFQEKEIKECLKNV